MGRGSILEGNEEWRGRETIEREREAQETCTFAHLNHKTIQFQRSSDQNFTKVGLDFPKLCDRVLFNVAKCTHLRGGREGGEGMIAGGTEEREGK